MSTTNNRTPKSTNLRYCAFCGRNENQVNFLIPSPSGIYICDFCVEACSDLIYETQNAHQTEELSFESLQKPRQLKDTLDQYVIGQDDAKIALSVAVYNHYKRILNKSTRSSDRRKNKNDTPAEHDVEL